MEIKNKDLNLKNPFIYEKFIDKFPWFKNYIDPNEHEVLNVNRTDIKIITTSLLGSVLFVPYHPSYTLQYKHLFDEYKYKNEIIYFKFFNSFGNKFEYFAEFEWMFVIKTYNPYFISKFPFGHNVKYSKIDILIYKIDHDEIISKMKNIEFNASAVVNELVE